MYGYLQDFFVIILTHILKTFYIPIYLIPIYHIPSITILHIPQYNNIKSKLIQDWSKNHNN